jgi:hypothetical protein
LGALIQLGITSEQRASAVLAAFALAGILLAPELSAQASDALARGRVTIKQAESAARSTYQDARSVLDGRTAERLASAIPETIDPLKQDADLLKAFATEETAWSTNLREIGIVVNHHWEQFGHGMERAQFYRRAVSYLLPGAELTHGMVASVLPDLGGRADDWRQALEAWRKSYEILFRDPPMLTLRIRSDDGVQVWTHRRRVVRLQDIPSWVPRHEISTIPVANIVVLLAVATFFVLFEPRGIAGSADGRE